MIEFHTHNGIDSPRVNPMYLQGFPIFLSNPPTHKATEGTIIFVNKNSFVYLYVMINKVWNLLSIAPAKGFLSSTTTLNFGVIAPNTSADLTMTVIGASDGDSVLLGVQNIVISTGTNCVNISFFAWISATDTVTIRCTNHDLVNTANPASGTFRSSIIQF